VHGSKKGKGQPKKFSYRRLAGQRGGKGKKRTRLLRNGHPANGQKRGGRISKKKKKKKKKVDVTKTVHQPAARSLELSKWRYHSQEKEPL